MRNLVCAALFLILASPGISRSAENCSGNQSTCTAMCYGASVMSGGSPYAAASAMDCMNRCNEQASACEARNEAAAAQQAALQRQAEARETAQRAAAVNEREAAVKAWLDKTTRELSSRFPGRAVIPAGLVLPDPDRPRLRPFAQLPDGEVFGIGSGGLFYGAGQEDYESQGASGQFSRLDFSTGELKALGIGRVIGFAGRKLPDGRHVLVVIEHHRAGTYVVHVLDLQGKPLAPAVDTGITAYVEEYESGRLPRRRDLYSSLGSAYHQGVLYLWASQHLEVGRIRSNQLSPPLDRNPLEAVSVDLANGRLLQRRSFAQVEALLIRMPVGEAPDARPRLYVASRSPATLTALDWESGSTIYAVPIATPNVSRLRSRPPESFAKIEFKGVPAYSAQVRDPRSEANPERLGVTVYYPGSSPYASDSAYFQSHDGAALGASITDFTLPKPAPPGASAPSMSLKDENPNQGGNDIGVFARDGRRLAGGFSSGVVVADDLVQVSKEGDSMELIDDTGRRVPLWNAGADLTRINAQYFLSDDYSIENRSGRYRTLWRMNDPLPADVQALIKALPKDEYETMADYGRRLSQTVASTGGEVRLTGYDADAQLQRLEIAGFAYEASLPVETARLFRGLKVARISGKVRAVAPDALEFFDVELAAEGVKAVPLANLRLRAPAASPTAGGATQAAACPADLSHLAARLPAYGLTELDTARDEILRTSIAQTISNARAQGYSAEAAINASLAQAGEYDRSARSALGTAASVDGNGTTADQFEQQLRSGTLRPTDCGNVRNSALCQAILSDMGAVASRAVAEAMQCRQRAGAF